LPTIATPAVSAGFAGSLGGGELGCESPDTAIRFCALGPDTGVGVEPGFDADSGIAADFDPDSGDISGCGVDIDPEVGSGVLARAAQALSSTSPPSDISARRAICGLSIFFIIQETVVARMAVPSANQQMLKVTRLGPEISFALTFFPGARGSAPERTLAEAHSSGLRTAHAART
jgi:hypothetical protein